MLTMYMRNSKDFEGDLPYKEGDFSGNTVLPTNTGVTLVYIINKIKN